MRSDPVRGREGGREGGRAKKFYLDLEYLGQPGGASHRLGNILLGMETVQIRAPYVLTDYIKAILFIKIVVM